jgi:hypothetical protein
MSRERSSSLVVALTAAAAFGGCFADAPADDTVDWDEPAGLGRGDTTLTDVLGGDPPPAVVHGTYRVPVPDDLAPFATYELDDASVEIVDGVLTVQFRLPEGLLGFTAPATFTGNVASSGGAVEVAVSGYMGHGSCRFDGGVECALAYYAVETDLTAVTEYWRARGDAFIDARVQVASLFDDDPLGVLRLSVE